MKAGFDWDEGNRQKCLKHGVSAAEIEALFEADEVQIYPDALHSVDERRSLAIGRTTEDRAVFVAFTLRERDGRTLIRPISARYMHRREVIGYAQDHP